MSKRHQSSRRKSYGRRQHELRERTGRRPEVEPLDTRVERFGRLGGLEASDFGEVEAIGLRFRFALAD
jgi:hypothetical protein